MRSSAIGGTSCTNHQVHPKKLSTAQTPTKPISANAVKSGGWRSSLPHLPTLARGPKAPKIFIATPTYASGISDKNYFEQFTRAGREHFKGSRQEVISSPQQIFSEPTENIEECASAC